MRILFLSRYFDTYDPRTIRSRSLFNAINSKGEHEVYHLSFSTGSSDEKMFCVKRGFLSSSDMSYDDLRKSFSILTILFMRLVYKLFLKNIFPDLLVLEKEKLKNHIEKIVLEKKIDVVVTFVMPYGFLELGDYIQSLGCLWVVDIGDPISNNIGKKNDGNESFRLKYEKESLFNADLIFTTNHETRDYYRDLLNGQNDLKFQSIYAGIPDYFRDSKKKMLSKDKIRIIYAGIFYIGRFRDPSNLIKTIEKLEFNGRRVELNVYGCRIKKFEGNESVKFFRNKIPQKELFNKYCDSDILLFVDNKFSIQVPSKLFELLSLKRPVLFIYYDENSPSVLIAKQYSHVIFSKNNREDIEKAISKCVYQYDKMIYNYPTDMNTWQTRSEKYVKFIESQKKISFKSR